MSELVNRLIASDPNWLETLTERYAVDAVHADRLVSLKYNQIESPMHEPIVQHCRGLVVDKSLGRVVAHPYNKFWNHGETLAAPIDWSTACVQEKLDGSLMILWWDTVDEEWVVSSSGTPRAGGSFGDEERTFAEAFWETFEMLNMRRPDRSMRDYVFMLELCRAENRVVVRHERPRLVLHGARNMVTGQEGSHRLIEGMGETFGWETVIAYPLTSIEGCLAAADALDPIAGEGFVVVDAQFNRVKIKSPRYVSLHHMKGEATLRRAIELWQTGEAGELLSHFPEMSPQIVPVHERLDAIAKAAVDGTNAALGASTRKEFALAVKDQPWSSVAFRLYGMSTDVDSAKAFMRTQSIAALERMLERMPCRHFFGETVVIGQRYAREDVYWYGDDHIETIYGQRCIHCGHTRRV